MTGNIGTRTDVGLRVAGTGLVIIACLCARMLFASGEPAAAQSAWSYAEAAAGFVCASAGLTLTLLGRHIFDQIKVSKRWRGYV